MIRKIETLPTLRKFLDGAGEDYRKMLADFDAKRSMGDVAVNAAPTQYWLAWNATALLGAATRAVAAQRIAVGTSKMAERGADEAAVLAAVRQEAIRAVTKSVSVDSRSTLVASNLAEDHERAFWVELLDALTPHEAQYGL